jgi:TIR domain
VADLFISYSRKDREFVLRLNQALEKRDYDVWVDLEDIPPTADWMEEVRSGIEGADAYVFVISPGLDRFENMPAGT